MLADVVIKILKSWTIEFSNLLKAFFELNQLQFGKILMEILGDGFPGWFEDGVPVVSVEVARQRDFVHNERILHLLLLYFVGRGKESSMDA